MLSFLESSAGTRVYTRVSADVASAAEMHSNCGTLTEKKREEELTVLNRSAVFLLEASVDKLVRQGGFTYKH